MIKLRDCCTALLLTTWNGGAWGTPSLPEVADECMMVPGHLIAPRIGLSIYLVVKLDLKSAAMALPTRSVKPPLGSTTSYVVAGWRS